MNRKILEAREYVFKAREALRRGDKVSARRFGKQAASLAPEMEDAWLVLAASEPNPEEALAYAHKALEVNPESARARRGVEWAEDRVKQSRVRKEAPVASPAFSMPRTFNPPPETKSKPRLWLYAVSFGVLVCLVLGAAAYSAAIHPAFASIVNGNRASTPEVLWAPMEIAKPVVTPLDVSAFAQQIESTPVPLPTVSQTPALLPTDTPTQTPTEVPTETPTATPEATETPGVLAMEIVPDTPTSVYVPPAVSEQKPPAAVTGNGTRWIDVDLTNQRVYAYEGDTIVNTFIVSTGTWLTPTVTGQYRIYVKYRSAKMSGPGYYLPNVPYVMYFYKGYGLHGTYWHNNFGTPMSHGCINLSIPDAEWLYNWASVGTLVNIHY